MITKDRRSGRGRWISARSLAVFLAAGIGVAHSVPVARAQSIDFQIGNVSLEQVTSSRSHASPEADAIANGENIQTSHTMILQHGDGNSATASTSGSPGSLIATLQAGEDNRNISVIVDSPGSKIGSVQIGRDNTAILGIVGGSGNTIGTAQIGSNLGALVGLVNSEDTTVLYGQAGKDYNGGIVIKNAPPGTVVRLN